MRKQHREQRVDHGDDGKRLIRSGAFTSWQLVDADPTDQENQSLPLHERKSPAQNRTHQQSNCKDLDHIAASRTGSVPSTDLEISQHLGRRRFKVQLHEKFQVIVDGIETGRNHQESIMIRLLTKRRHRSIERRLSVLSALQSTATSDASHCRP